MGSRATDSHDSAVVSKDASYMACDHGRWAPDRNRGHRHVALRHGPRPISGVQTDRGRDPAPDRVSGHIVIVVPSTSDEAGAATLETLRARLAALPGVRSVTTSANVQPQAAPAFRSIDGRGIAIVVAVSTEANDDQIDRIIAETRNASTDMFGPAVRVEGSAVVDKALGATTERDLLRADAIAVPIFLALLALVLRTRRALWWARQHHRNDRRFAPPPRCSVTAH